MKTKKHIETKSPNKNKRTKTSNKNNKSIPMSGNEVAAFAIKQINPDVIAAFPITPSTEIPEKVSKYISDGKMTTEFITVESEHSAISACIGASASGVRAMTATSSAGFALMHEMLYVASSSRLPIVLSVVNRALSGLLNINADHSDSFGSRDAGLIQLYSENAQEVYDNLLMANRIAENEKVLLPIMVCQDGFITSHAIDIVKLLSDKEVKSFVKKYNPKNSLLSDKEALAVGSYGNSPYYMEVKYHQHLAMKNAITVIKDVAKNFYKLTGRNYSFFEEYNVKNSKIVFVIIGSAAGALKDAIDTLKKEKKQNLGLIKIRVFRPFPVNEIVKALKGKEKVIVFNRAETLNCGDGALSLEVKAALFNEDKRAKVHSKFFGLGGRDIKVNDFVRIYKEVRENKFKDNEYIGLRK